MTLETETVRFTDKNGREWTPDVLAIADGWSGDFRYAVVAFPLKAGVSSPYGTACYLMRYGMPTTGSALASDVPKWRYARRQPFLVRRRMSAEKLVGMLTKHRPAKGRAERWMRDHAARGVRNEVAPELRIVIGKVPDRLLRYEAVHGDFGECVGTCACQVEPDGICRNGWPSWLRAARMI